MQGSKTMKTYPYQNKKRPADRLTSSNWIFRCTAKYSHSFWNVSLQRWISRTATLKIQGLFKYFQEQCLNKDFEGPWTRTVRHKMSCAKPIKMPFGMWSWVSLRKQILGEDSNQREGAILGGCPLWCSLSSTLIMITYRCIHRWLSSKTSTKTNKIKTT